ncbi:MAG: hypothetical protein LBP59_12275 [Planctomycetaceae bacterium]|nr:hypothetical protein [Planctomycetaceae bacterium]
MGRNTCETIILLVLEIQRFKSVKACRPKARQAKVNANSSTNSLLNFNNSQGLKYNYFRPSEIIKFIVPKNVMRRFGTVFNFFSRLPDK